MKKLLLFTCQALGQGLFLLCFFNVMLSAQPAIEWQRTFGGSDFESASCIQQTNDNGYIISGYTNSNDGDVFANHGINDFWVLKLDDDATIQWKRTYGGINKDWAYCIQQTKDGGFVIAGDVLSNDGDVTGNHGSFDCWVVKINELGSIEWQKALGGSQDESAHCIHQSIDGGYILAGETYSNNGDVFGNHGNSDCWVVKLDESGDIQWQRALGGSQFEHGYSIQQTLDKGYILAGSASSIDGNLSLNYGNYDYWVVKLNEAGEIQWQNVLGGSDWDEPYSIQQTIDGGFIIGGDSYSKDGDVSINYGDRDYWVVKLNAIGNIQWQKSLGGNNSDIALSVKQTIDGAFIVAGYTYSDNGDVTGNHGTYDCWIAKLDIDGNLTWQKTLGGSAYDHASSIQQTSDGGFVFAGASSSMDGDLTENKGHSDFWVVKLSSESVSTENIASQEPKLEISPNPAHQSITLKTPSEESALSATITNLLGHKITSQTIVNGGQMDVSTLVKGLYLVTATTPSGKIFSSKMCKME